MDLFELIGSSDEHVRLKAIERAALEPEERSVPLLLKAMRDGDIRLRNMARDLTLKMEPEALLPYLEVAMRDGGDADLRNAAMDIYAALSSSSVPELNRLVADADPEIRNFACVLLGNIGDKRGVPALLGALNDEEANVKHAAAEALGKTGDPSAVPCLLEALASEMDWWSAFPVVAALGELRDERAVYPLLKRLDDEPLRVSIAMALGEIASQSALETMLPLLDEEDEGVKTQALLAVVKIQERTLRESPSEETETAHRRLLERINTSWLRQHLLDLLPESEPEVKRAALVALGWLRESRAVPRMIDALKEEPLSESALEALVSIGLPALNNVELSLEHPVGMVRQALVRYLGSIRLPFSGPPLRQMLKDELSIVRAQAALALGNLGDIDAADGLIEALGDVNPEVQESAVTALANLNPQIICGKLLPYLNDKSQRYIFLAAEALGQLGLDEAINPLSTLLMDERDIIREVAVKSIGLIGGGNSVGPLFTALGDGSPRVRQQAILSLGRVKEKIVLKKLVSLLAEPDDAVKYFAIRALKKQGSAEAALPLLKLLDGSPPRNISVAAADALGATGCGDACGPLLELARSGDADLAMAAIRSLGELGCVEAKDELLGLLAHGDWSIKAVAAASLGRIGGEGVLYALARLLGSRDRVICSAGIKALGELGDPSASRHLVPLLADAQCQKQVLDSLALLGPGSVKGVIEALHDAPPALLLKGIRLVGRMKDPEGAGYLSGLLRHPDPSIRKEAAAALGDSGFQEALGILDETAKNDGEPIVREAAASSASIIKNQDCLDAH